MFADDLKMYRIISSVVDCIALQQDIDTVDSWCVSNGMLLNAGKCKIISFRRSRPLISFEYTIDGDEIERVESIKDLGVIMDSKLKFNEHISLTTAKGFSLLGFVRRNAADFDDVYALKTLYSCFVRSVLEYAVPVWAPYHETQIQRLERVQRSFFEVCAKKASME